MRFPADPSSPRTAIVVAKSWAFAEADPPPTPLESFRHRVSEDSGHATTAFLAIWGVNLNYFF